MMEPILENLKNVWENVSPEQQKKWEDALDYWSKEYFGRDDHA